MLKGSGATSSELAEGLGVTKQAAGQIIDDLEQRGYVERRPDGRCRARNLRPSSVRWRATRFRRCGRSGEAFRFRRPVPLPPRPPCRRRSGGARPVSWPACLAQPYTTHPRPHRRSRPSTARAGPGTRF
ncbi:MarR family transcriptional regulator [Streptomyces sp. BH055]|uniref:MarR family transcriptional regulator n=1 Tax=Streptomyces sp. BH055 TaxID=3401173 RepID=UPI003BB53FB2